MNIPSPDDIKAAAKAKGLSIAAVCRRANLDATAFYRWQKQINTPNLATVQKMIDAIDSAPTKKVRARCRST